jgi:hypothetical protein
MGAESGADVLVVPGVTKSGVINSGDVGVQVYELVQNVVNGPHILPQYAVPNLQPYISDSVWVSIMCTVDVYIIWGNADNVPPDPLVAADIAANQTQQCIRIPGNFEYMRVIPRGFQFKLLQADSADNVFCRLEVVQPIRYT